MVNYAYTAYGIPSKSINENLQGEFINEALSIMEENIFLYTGYIYDCDTNMYYCQSRYYDPEIGRWLSIDDVGYLDSQSVHGLNLYAYCRNNPVMLIDRYGTSPEWWHWAASGAMVVAGIALMFTPLGILGGALVTAGVSSMVGGYISEEAGGSFTAGWVGGAVAGFVTGLGAGAASSLYYAATMSATGGTFYAMGSFAVAGISGFIGNFGGSLLTQSMDGKTWNVNQAMQSGIIAGLLSIPFIPFSAGSIVFSKIGHHALSAGYSILVETISQVASYLVERITSEIHGSSTIRFPRSIIR